MNTRQVEQYIKSLSKQAVHMEGRIEKEEYDKTHFLRAELLALKWVIAYAEDTILEAADHQNKWFNERVK